MARQDSFILDRLPSLHNWFLRSFFDAIRPFSLSCFFAGYFKERFCTRSGKLNLTHNSIHFLAFSCSVFLVWLSQLLYVIFRIKLIFFNYLYVYSKSICLLVGQR